MGEVSKSLLSEHWGQGVEGVWEVTYMCNLAKDAAKIVGSTFTFAVMCEQSLIAMPHGNGPLPEAPV